MAITGTFACFQGDHLDVIVSVEDEDGAAVNVTGHTFVFAVEALGVQYYLLTMSTGVSVTNGPEGEVTATLTADQTEVLPARQYNFALRRTNPGSEVTVAKGRMTVEAAAAVIYPAA